MRPRVLIIDDERNFREFLAEALDSHGYEVDVAGTASLGLSRAAARAPHVVLLDQNLPDRPGLEILPDLRRLRSNPVVIVLTAYAEYSRAVTAMKAGAFHYIGKPFEFSDLLAMVGTACVGFNDDAPDSGAPLAGLVGGSPAIVSLKQRIAQIARSPVASVLLQGESGTGKEVVARGIHDLSPRSRRSMISVNCAALSESLLMSELFGHEKGAFTDARERKKGVFEAANGGTLFLDEVSEMGPRAQAALLRVLEQRTVTRVGGTEEMPVDIRIIAATNRPLEDMIADGAFRSDLFYRLNVVQLGLPPLRERRADVPVLARHFSQQIAAQYGVPARSLSAAVEEVLLRYSWPGNVRELRNAVERSYVLGDSVEITPADLPAEITDPATPAAGFMESGADEGQGFQRAKQEVVEQFERSYLEALLQRTLGNVTRAAQEAGMLRQGFQKLLIRHGIDARLYRQ